MMAEVDYVLGHGEGELRRLELRGSLFAPVIKRMLSSAGLGPGMSVLDIGTGAGDAAVVAAELVGPSGSVLGIDKEASVLARARARTEAANFGHVRYINAKPDDLPASERFDFVLSCRVLGHVPDPVVFLRQAAARVRPGGIFAQLEVALPVPDLPRIETTYRWSVPPVPLFDKAADLCMAAFALGGSRGSDGARMVELFHEAGLSEPSLTWEEQASGAGGPVVEILCMTLATLLPALQKYGVVTAAEIGLDTLQFRMKEAVAKALSQVRFDNLVCAWTSISENIPASLRDSDVLRKFDKFGGSP